MENEQDFFQSNRSKDYKPYDHPFKRANDAYMKELNQMSSKQNYIQESCEFKET
jgi:hypothetical protein